MQLMLSLAKELSCCGLAGDVINCEFVVNNTGNVQLNLTQLSGDANCSLLSSKPLQPGTSALCSLAKSTNQSNFEVGSISWAVSTLVKPFGTNTSLFYAHASGGIPLNRRPVLTVRLVRVATSDSKLSTADLVVKADSVVVMLVNVSNTGNVHMYNVSVSIPGLTNPLNCSSNLRLMPVDSSLMCTGSFTFDQDALEVGSRNFQAMGTGIAAAGDSVTANSSIITVPVGAAPCLQVIANASSCTKPSRMRKYTAHYCNECY